MDLHILLDHITSASRKGVYGMGFLLGRCSGVYTPLFTVGPYTVEDMGACGAVVVVVAGGGAVVVVVVGCWAIP